MKTSSITAVGIIVVIALLILFGFAFWPREHLMLRIQISSPSPSQMSSPLFSLPTPSPISDDQQIPVPISAMWKTYTNKTIGLSFSHPKEYCVVFRTRGELIEEGHFSLEDLSSADYYLEIQNPRDPEEGPLCQAIFILGYYPVAFIQIFKNPEEKTLVEWLQYYEMLEVKRFWLPPIALNGIQALPFIFGEGRPNTGAPGYSIIFQTDDLIFSVSVDDIPTCTAKDGSCKSSRDQQRIDEVMSIAKTIQFIPREE
jgi:hypothetical protein